MGEWKEYKMAEICSLITDGKHGDCKDESNSGFYFISAKDVKDGKINYDNARQITRADFEETDRRTNFSVGDIVLTNSGTIGRMAVGQDIPETRRTTFQKSVAILKPINDIVSSEFLYYRLMSKQRYIVGLAGGTTQQNLLLGDLRDFEITIPNKIEQTAISSILSELDDKIDLLYRQNKTLESLAETLFRKWFVEEADESWESGTLEDEFDFTMGQSPPGDSYNEDGMGTIFFQGRTDFDFRFPKTRMFTTKPFRFAHQFDTLISVRAPVGDMNMAFENCCIGRGLSAFRYKKDEKFYSYTYYKLRSLMRQIKLFEDSGTVFGSIKKEDFKNFENFIPAKEIIGRFQDKVHPVDIKIYRNTKQIHTLTKLRDALLPKLMNGEIRVNYE